MKMTRAYIEGYFEGRFGNLFDIRCPHVRTASANEFDDGVARGIVLRHFAHGTVPAKTEHADALRQIKLDRGDIK